MKLLFSALVCMYTILLLNSALFAQPENFKSFKERSDQQDEIHFKESTWQQALTTARESQKYIFVDAYASWCKPCKLLRVTTFKNKEAATFFNEHFLNLSIDMEKGEGVSLAAEWGVEAYPTLIILSPVGKPVLATVGFLEARDLINFGKQALEKR